MADLSPARGPERLHLTDTEGREVVVKHEFLVGLPFESLDLLFVFCRPEGGDDQSLRLPSDEERRTVGPGQDSHMAGYRPYLVRLSAVGTGTLVQDLASHDLFLVTIEDAGDLSRECFLRGAEVLLSVLRCVEHRNSVRQRHVESRL